MNARWSSHKKDFTIHVEVRKNTAIFCRTETKSEEVIGPDEFKGYGHSFERRCTRREVTESTGHHRIISYNFGSLRFIVRHETDEYVGAAGAQYSWSKSNTQYQSVDALSHVLGSLALSPEGSISCKASANSNLVIRKAGQTIPLESTMEIKTRVAHKPFDFGDIVSQLWISQTPKLVRAYHTRGVFTVPKVEDVVAKVKAWENENQKDLRMLASLVDKIRNVVK